MECNGIRDDEKSAECGVAKKSGSLGVWESRSLGVTESSESKTVRSAKLKKKKGQQNTRNHSREIESIVKTEGEQHRFPDFLQCLLRHRAHKAPELRLGNSDKVMEVDR